MIQKTNNTVTIFDTAPAKKIHIADETKALGMLYGLIYTDPKVAAMREYVTNARDTHIQNKINRPVTIMVAGGEFVVRDYGPGLSSYDMEAKFLACCSTTKDNTNEQYGTFGVGALAALAYSDMFEVISYHNGHKTTYIVRNSNGSPSYSIGKLEPWTGDSGVEVRVPIRGDDHGTFLDIASALRFLCGMADSIQAIEVLASKISGTFGSYKFCGDVRTELISDVPCEVRSNVRLRPVVLKEKRTLWELMQDIRKQYGEVENWLNACEAYDAGTLDTMPELPSFETFSALCSDSCVPMIVPGAALKFNCPFYSRGSDLLADAMGNSCAYDGNTVIRMKWYVTNSDRPNLAYMAPVGALSYSPSREGVIVNNRMTDLIDRAEKRVDRFLNGLVAARMAWLKENNKVPSNPSGIYASTADRCLEKVLYIACRLRLGGKWCKDARPCVPVSKKGWLVFDARAANYTCSIRKYKYYTDPSYVGATGSLFVTGVDCTTDDTALAELRSVRHALYDESPTGSFNLIALTDAAVKEIKGMADGCEAWFRMVDIADLRQAQEKHDIAEAEARKASRKTAARVTKAEPARFIYTYPDNNKTVGLGDPLPLENVNSSAKMSNIKLKGKAFSNTLVVSKALVDTSLSAPNAAAPHALENGLSGLLGKLLHYARARRAAGIERICVVPVKYLEEAAAEMSNTVTIRKLAEELVSRMQAVFTHNNVRLLHPGVAHYLCGLLGLNSNDEEKISYELQPHFDRDTRASLPVGLLDAHRSIQGLFCEIDSAREMYYAMLDLFYSLSVWTPPTYVYNEWISSVIPGVPKPSGKDTDAAVVHAGMRHLPYIYRDSVSEAFRAKAAKADDTLIKSIRRNMMKYSIPFDIKSVFKRVAEWRKQREAERMKESEEASKNK